MNKIFEKACEVYPDTNERVYCESYFPNIILRDGFTAGAEWMQNEIIEKTELWIKLFLSGNAVDDYRKFLEDQDNIVVFDKDINEGVYDEDGWCDLGNGMKQHKKGWVIGGLKIKDNE